MKVERENVEEFSQEYLKLKDRDKEDFSRIANKLLAKTFIVCDLNEDKDDYYTSLRFFYLLSVYFSFIDYLLFKNELNRIVYIKTTKDRNRFHLNKIDTIIALIFRAKYFEKSKEISLDRIVTLTIEELVEEINKTKIYQSQKTITEIERALKVLRRNKICNFVGKVTKDTVIEILPTILILIKVSDIEDIKNKVLNYINDSEDNEEDAEDENVSED